MLALCSGLPGVINVVLAAVRDLYLCTYKRGLFGEVGGGKGVASSCYSPLIISSSLWRFCCVEFLTHCATTHLEVYCSPVNTEEEKMCRDLAKIA